MVVIWKSSDNQGHTNVADDSATRSRLRPMTDISAIKNDIVFNIFSSVYIWEDWADSVECAIGLTVGGAYCKAPLGSDVHPPQHWLTSHKLFMLWHPFLMAQWLEFSFCGQLWLSPGPYCPSSRIQSAKETVLYSKLLLNKPRTLWRLPQALGSG